MGRDDLARQAVDAINAISGHHPGHRAAHAKGTLCAATFTPTPEASRLTRAAHFRDGPVRAHVRFSNGSGDPTASDCEPREGRGMATKFYLDDGTTTDAIGITLPAFFVNTVDGFLDFCRARTPQPATGEPDPAAIGEFLEKHPEALTAGAAVLAARLPLRRRGRWQQVCPLPVGARSRRGDRDRGRSRGPRSRLPPRRPRIAPRRQPGRVQVVGANR